MLIKVNSNTPQIRLLNRVAESLRDGGIIAYPTDTTYGIGCSIFSKRSIERIYQIKKREKSKPFSFICSSIAEVSKFARVDNATFKILKRYLPGPYTFILEATRDVPDLLLTRQKTVGIRIPDNIICNNLVNILGNPLITTSANLTGEIPVGDPLLIRDIFGGDLKYIVDGGTLNTDVSSVISLLGSNVEVLRSGLGDVTWCKS